MGLKDSGGRYTEQGRREIRRMTDNWEPCVSNWNARSGERFERALDLAV
jgi:hypothetical protein